MSLSHGATVMQTKLSTIMIRVRVDNWPWRIMIMISQWPRARLLRRPFGGRRPAAAAADKIRSNHAPRPEDAAGSHKRTLESRPCAAGQSCRGDCRDLSPTTGRAGGGIRPPALGKFWRWPPSNFLREGFSAATVASFISKQFLLLVFNR
jgi:hypothetical protein